MILYHMTNQTFEEISTTEFWTNMLKSLGIKKQKWTWDDNDKRPNENRSSYYTHLVNSWKVMILI